MIAKHSKRYFKAALLAIAAVACFLALGPFSTVARAGEQGQLTQEQIRDRFIEIGSEYAPGDKLSDDDAAFVWRYTTHDDGVRVLRTSANVNVSGSGYGTSVSLKGTTWHNGTFNYNFGGNLTGTVTAGPVPKKMTVTVYCQSYGIVGSSTVLLYSDSVSHTSYNSKTVKMNKSKNYSGVAAFYAINAQIDVTTAAGSGFTVNA